MGVYTSCEIDSALSTCEANDAEMVQEGFSWEINYIGLAAHETGGNSLQAWLQNAAAIGLGIDFSVKAALKDSNLTTGTSLISTLVSGMCGTNSCLAQDCGATTDEQLISCIYSIASNVPGLKYEWYIYDEPGCPNQSIGYCAGSLAGGNYGNVAALAQYIESIDPTHAVRGVNTPGGCSGGCSSGSNASGEATAASNLFSWLANSTTSNTGFDYYPIPENIVNNDIGDIGYIAGDVANVISSDYAAESSSATLQAFSWYQEGFGGCSSETVCPFPTETQMQEMRDEALYYANKAGHPLSRIYWYYWADINCANTYPGCSASTNLANLKTAMTAPFPATPPPLNI